MSFSVGILGTGRAVPDQVLTNADLEKRVDTTDEWITSRTGIRERRIAPNDMAASDLGALAGRRALESANLSAEDIDLIIVATITGDMPFPATACIIQDKIGAKNAAAFDLSAGCSGFVYALDVAKNMVLGGSKRVLVIGVDLLSRVTDYSDRATCVLFGDGAGAAIVGAVADGYGIIATDIGADGAGAEFLKLPAGGSRRPVTDRTIENREHYLCMAGNEVFKFAVRIMGDSTHRVLAKARLTSEDIRWFIPHQANIRIIKSAATRLGISDDRLFINVERYGNTSAASIPLALDEIVESRTLNDGDYLLVVGFGAGLTWGAAIIRWGGIIG